MRRIKTGVLSLLTAMTLLGTASVSTVAVAMEWPDEKACREAVKSGDKIIKGWCTAISRRAGNCLGCHQAMVSPWPEKLAPGGNIGPPLVAMKARFPNREDLRAQIWDPTARNPNTSMPPFGKHGLLSEEQIDSIVDWLMTI